MVGKIGDTTRRRVLLNLLSLFLHGINTLLSFFCQSYATLFIYSVFCGIFTGAYNALLCVAVLDCVRQKKLPQAFGFMTFFQSLGLLAGSPIAGLL